MDGQDVDVNRGTMRFMEGEGILKDKQTSDIFRGSSVIRGPEVSSEGQSSYHGQPLSVPQ